jgi:hypothetical protein
VGLSPLCIPRTEEREQSRLRRVLLGSLSSIPLSLVLLQGFGFAHLANPFLSKGFIPTKCSAPLDEPSVESRRDWSASAATIRVVVLYRWLVSREKARDLLLTDDFHSISNFI